MTTPKETGPNTYIQREMEADEMANASLNEPKIEAIKRTHEEQNRLAATKDDHRKQQASEPWEFKELKRRQGLEDALGARLATTTNGPVEAADWANTIPSIHQQRPSIIHRIKSTSPYFEAVNSTRKHAELRKDDRGYAENDYLVINRCIPAGYGLEVRYTGQHVLRKITHVLRDMEGMLPGYCVISMEQISPSDSTLEYLMRNPEPEEMIKARRAREAKIENEQEKWHGRGFDYIIFDELKVGDQIKVNMPTFKSADEWHNSGQPLEIDPAGFFGIPDDVYFHAEHGNFYRVSKNPDKPTTGCGDEFYWKWAKHIKHFPKSENEVRFRGQQWGDNKLDPIPPRLPAKSTVTHHENELLLHLTQEAGEVIQAITKLQFFGKETVVHRGVSYNNTKSLGVEIGNLQHMINVVQAAGLVDEKDVRHGMAHKLEGLDKHLTKK